MKGEDLLNLAMGWLRENYAGSRFYVERDVVWTIQTRLASMIQEYGLQYRVFNDFGLLPGPRRSLSADIVLIGADGTVDTAVEFKFEPSHLREDILNNKFPVVEWGVQGVAGDLRRIRDFVAAGKARTAYAILIDEGGYFRRRPIHESSSWIDWGHLGADLNVSILCGRSGQGGSLDFGAASMLNLGESNAPV